jgi:hypothetical protein
MKNSVEFILRDARRARKHDWTTYNGFRGRLINLNLTYQEYEQACRKLAEVLGV